MNHFLILFYSILIMRCSVVTRALNTSSRIICLPHESSALLRLKQEFALEQLGLIDVLYLKKPPSVYDQFRGRMDKVPTGNPKMMSWETRKDCCKWEGVTCDMETGQVARLDLSSSWLQGPLGSNSSLFSLHGLQRLNLAFNNFTFSPIPPTFSQLSRLTHLNLSYSSFSGRVPSEITGLNNLISLDLSSYAIFDIGDLQYFLTATIPQNMTNLRVLHMDGVNLSSSIPQSLGNMSSLISLSLFGCKLHGEFPKSIFQLPNIQAIDVSRNLQLTGFLPEFQSKSKLESLILGSTGFSGQLPYSIGNLKSLKEIELGGCDFSGNIPSSVGNMSQLAELYITYSHLSGHLPSMLGNLSELRFLILSGNSFSGQLFSTVGNLAKLIMLELRDCGLSGELPTSFGNLNQLESLDIQGNRFEGQIPATIGNFTKLKDFGIGNNSFTGILPSSIANLTHLGALLIRDTLLTGVIPSSLFTMPSLYLLWLDNNQFSGPLTIPNVSSTSQLKTLSLTENKLNGQIPSSISQLKNLQRLSLVGNSFSGAIEIGMFSELSQLRFLDLSKNSLSVLSTSTDSTLLKRCSLGLTSCNRTEFPDMSRSQLVELDISNNKLEGKIPKWFLSIGTETLSELNLSHNSISSWEHAPVILPWNNLQILDLRSNSLQGSLVVPPLSTGFFFISNNKLTGRIHPLFCNLSYPVVLDLSNNRLGGTIPQCFDGFRSLSVLNMKGNQFQGRIPQMFLNGSQLRTLDLSDNQLRGRVPQSLINCGALEVVNLGYNQINDIFPFWLQNLPQLQVLVLRSNKFHGPIWEPREFLGFVKLRIVDLSFNNFSGNLSSDYFGNWSAINNGISTENKPTLRYMKDGDRYYQDSVTVTMKGSDILFEKILTIFTSIDLSNNNFCGEIPSTIGDLKQLIVLNLSSNNFEGLIPSSFGNLTQLESLDLSGNMLTGRIPQELASLTFLAYLNLSDNQLTGQIPRGPQFNTFPNSSFQGNLELCGFPLSKKCESVDETPTPDYGQESGSESGFGWKPVLIGYGCGFIIGVIGGYVLFSKKPNLFIKIYGREKRW